MGERRPEAGAPDHGVRLPAGAIRSLGAVRSEVGKRWDGVVQPGVAGCTDRRDGDDVAERCDAAGVGVAFVECLAACGRRREEHAAVDAVREVARWSTGHPGDLRVRRQVGGDLGAGVPPADDDDALPGELGGIPVPDGVDLPSGEVAPAVDGGQEGPKLFPAAVEASVAVRS